MSKFQECADCSSAFCAVHRECTNGKAKAIMTDTFDPTPQRKPDDMLALAAGVLDAATKGGVRFKKHAIEAAAAYLRTRIEAAFVPVDDHDERVRVLQEHAMDERDLRVAATARAEAAEARVKALAELLEAYDDATPEHDDRCSVGALYNCTCDLQDVKVRARAALGEEHDK